MLHPDVNHDDKRTEVPVVKLVSVFKLRKLTTSKGPISFSNQVNQGFRSEISFSLPGFIDVLASVLPNVES